MRATITIHLSGDFDESHLLKVEEWLKYYMDIIVDEFENGSIDYRFEDSSVELEEIHVDSSNLETVAYDPRKEHLQVVFRGGNKYIYEDVTREEFEGLLSAPSRGHYLATHIKPTHKVMRFYEL